MVTGPRTEKAKKYLIAAIIFIVLFNIIMRFLKFFVEFPLFIEQSKDVDFALLLEGFTKNGLLNFYNAIPVPSYVPEWPPYYLYFWYFIFFSIGWYFIFFPMELIPFAMSVPFAISVTIWNILSGAIVIYVCLKCIKKFENALDLRNFYGFLLIGFLIDMWYGNSNFLILLFLFLSYKFLEKDKKWLSGIFFTLSTFKINAILFIPFIILSKKIKLKELYYYIVPLLLMCLPYFIFPNYLLQMLENWGHSDPGIVGLTVLDPITWKALQPSHLLYISFLYLFYMEHFEEGRRKRIFRTVIITGFSIYYAYISTVVFILPNFLTLL